MKALHKHFDTFNNFINVLFPLRMFWIIETYGGKSQKKESHEFANKNKKN